MSAVFALPQTGARTIAEFAFALGRSDVDFIMVDVGDATLKKNIVFRNFVPQRE